MPAPVVLTRSTEDNQPIAKALRERGIAVVERPCVRLRTVPAHMVEGPFEAVAFTSRSGVRGFFENNLDAGVAPRHVGVVGDSTAAEVRAHGWPVTVQPAIATAEELGRCLGKVLVMGNRVLWPRGNLSTGTLAPTLADRGIRLVELQVYVNEEIDVEPVGECSTVVVASPSAVRRFLAANPDARRRRFVAIGSKTAEAARDAGVEIVVEAPRPSVDDIVEAVLAEPRAGHVELRETGSGLGGNRMARKTSETLFRRACSVIPGGVNSPVRAFGAVGGHPVYFRRGRGGSFEDADGNSYMDLCLSWGPLILGHAHPAVVTAVEEAARDGLSFGACHEREIQLAEAVLRAFPEYEKMRAVSSGTEAVMSAIRVARGATGRPFVLKFEGCYHGHSDGLLVAAGSGLVTQGIATSAGVPPEVAGTTLVAPLDDEERLRAIFASHGDRIAAAIIEPLPANAGLLEQRREFLQLLRDLTRQHGALLIFDEVISGFRLRFGGYGQQVDIRADIVTLGKIIGGGMPVGALVSSAAIMDHLAPLGKVYQAGTLSGNPVSLAAGLATLRILEDGTVYADLERLAGRLDESLHRAGVRSYRRVGSIFWPHFDDGPLPRRPTGVSARAVERYNSTIHRSMLERGYYLPPSAWEVSFLCSAHTPEQIDGFAAALGECSRA